MEYVTNFFPDFKIKNIEELNKVISNSEKLSQEFSHKVKYSKMPEDLTIEELKE
jgi:hypothetical protein